MITEVNVRVKLPGGEIVRANRQPASTGKLERAGIIGEANAHTFFLNGSLELNLSATLTVVARRQGRALVDLPAASYRVFEIKDVDAWDYHTEVLTVESATGAANDLTEAWTRKRFIPSGGKTETGGPAGTWVPETVMLKFIAARERGDEYDDFSPISAEVLAQAETLLPGDLLTSPVHGTFQVRGVTDDGAYQKGRLER